MLSSTEFFRNPSVELPPRDAVVSACNKEYEAKNYQTNNLLWPDANEPDLFVKFGPEIDASEAENQRYFHKMTIDSKTIRIPEVYWVFSEYTTVPPPKDTAPGPINGGKLRHQLFRHHVAPKKFGDNQELGKYISHAASLLAQRTRVQFMDDDLAMYYTDIHKDNFLKDAANRICPVDFEHAGIAPGAFMAMVLKLPKHSKLADLVLPHFEHIDNVTKPVLDCMNLALTAHQMGVITGTNKE